ncbi:MAG TPA: hypothetical protein VFF65_07590 [Phycisphaerales bacterium]|nr:hypothetical protein [Phycisphaerales bacterium]
MPTATLLTERGKSPVLRFRNGAMTRVVQRWRVDTDDEKEAMTAPELPAYGDVLGPSGDDAGLSVVDHEVEFEGGDYCIVHVIYESAAGSGALNSRPRPAPNLAYTERTYSVQTVNVKYALPNVLVGTGTSHDPNLPIAGGDGAPKEVIATHLVVTIWRSPADYSNADDMGLEELQGSVITNELDLPPIFGTAVPLTYRRRKLRYLFSDVKGEAGLVKIEHHFEARTDHLFHWRKQDDKGNAIGDEQTSAIYEVADFPQAALR